MRYHIIDAEKTCFAAQDIHHTMRVTAQTVTSKYIRGVREKELTDSSSVSSINASLKVCSLFHVHLRLELHLQFTFLV